MARDAAGGVGGVEEIRVTPMRGYNFGACRSSFQIA
jgi:hypothetical protein